MDVGWELPTPERQRATHITLLRGHIEGGPAVLVFQDMTASLVRAGTPEQWRRMMDRGVHIAGARARWQEGRREVEPDEIRSTFWEAHKEGVHPDTIGSYLVDRLIPRRKQHELVRDDVGLVDPGPSLEETAISDIERAAFREALAASPERDQEIIRRRYVLGETDAAIARALGISQHREQAAARNPRTAS
ncbi:MAG: sigma-70 family RNA polymerase sigma factor [Chloroflexi bacterium]|nr:MAG: sigma-70 family RNA polymerase sigma factor [Chloroflexota bacterium]